MSLPKTQSQYYITVPVNEELQKLIYQYGQRVELEDKECFIKPGDEIKAIHYIDKGMMIHFAASEEGLEKAYYISTAGSFVNECLFSVHGKSVIAKNYVKAKVPCVLYRIDCDTYNKLMKYPIFINTLQYSFYQKYKKLQFALDNICFNTAGERLLNLYAASVRQDVDPADKEWLPIQIHFKQQELATIIGVHRVSIGRLITELCKEGCIRIVNRRTEIRRDIVYSIWNKD